MASRADLSSAAGSTPVALPAEAWDDWLDPGLTDPVASLAILLFAVQLNVVARRSR